jgi:hypothetical protein
VRVPNQQIFEWPRSDIGQHVVVFRRNASNDFAQKRPRSLRRIGDKLVEFIARVEALSVRAVPCSDGRMREIASDQFSIRHPYMRFYRSYGAIEYEKAEGVSTDRLEGCVAGGA